jgi:protein gp37
MDIFDDEVRLDWYAETLKTVKACTELDFLLVTKRPELWLPRTRAAMQHYAKAGSVNDEFCAWLENWIDGEVPPNVWVITSAEDQPRLDKRVYYLIQIPAVVHGLSCEPLLEGLTLRFDRWLAPDIKRDSGRTDASTGVNWVIGGGESGPHARLCNVFWLDSIRKQCAAAGVAYFNKQLGRKVYTDNANAHEWPDDTCMFEIAGVDGFASAEIALKHKKGGDPAEWPEELRVRQWPDITRP